MQRGEVRRGRQIRAQDGARFGREGRDGVVGEELRLRSAGAPQGAQPAQCQITIAGDGDATEFRIKRQRNHQFKERIF
jgi:hypothetical protein